MLRYMHSVGVGVGVMRVSAVGNPCRSMQYVPCVVALVFALRVVHSCTMIE